MDFFNGNPFGLHLKGISGSIDVTKENANGEKRKIGPLSTPAFFESRRNYALPHDEFTFALTQELPRKFSDELKSWPEGTTYSFDLAHLNIIVQSEDDARATRLPLWDGFLFEKRDGRILTNKQIFFRPGAQMRGLSHLIEKRK